LNKLENNARSGEGGMTAVMKRKRYIMDYDPIQMITGAGLVFMMISLNGWIGGVIQGGHEADHLAQGK